jgi:hypothetical protein
MHSRRSGLMGSGSIRLGLTAVTVMLLGALAWGVADRRFDVCTFNCTPDGSDPHMCQDGFDALNFTTTNGHFICMGTDAHRTEVNNAGNFLGAYYNSLTSLYGTYDSTAAADQIENYIVTNFTNTGVETTWVAINEISYSLWPSSADYRLWVRQVMARLHQTYSHSVILWAPFQNPVNNATDWVPLSGNAYIGIEKYISGATVNANGNSVSWCQSQYQSSLNSYLNLGIARAQLYLSEDYEQTVSGVAYGRGGCSYAGWDNAIKARASAIHNILPAGYISFAWEHNDMHVSDADMVHFETTYATKVLP